MGLLTKTRNLNKVKKSVHLQTVANTIQLIKHSFLIFTFQSQLSPYYQLTNVCSARQSLLDFWGLHSFFI